MIFHQIQVMAGAALAWHYARSSLQAPDADLRQAAAAAGALPRRGHGSRTAISDLGRGRQRALTDARTLGHYAVAGSAGCAVYAIAELPTSCA